MHELGLAQETLDLAVAAAEKEHGAKIISLRIEIGAMSGVEPEAFRFALETIAGNTMADHATIIIETTEGRELNLLSLEVNHV
jgi:hydrogenase nickel incorporation protein HypA/HybF